ncbi:hypothetical protein KR018_011553, partial [Drosophila ironensis]
PKKEPPKPDKSHPPPQPKMRTREEILRDKCITDFCLKGASGLLVGGVFTLCFTRPQTFPLWLGMGIGMGIAYDCCNVRRSTM